MPLHPRGCEVERLTLVEAVAGFYPARTFMDVGWVVMSRGLRWTD